MKLKLYSLLLPLLALPLLVLACGGGSESATPTQTAGTTPSAVADLVAVAEQIFPNPQDPKGDYDPTCSGGYSSCPITSRLRNHLTQEKITLCRCQNLFGTRTVTVEVTPDGGIAHVHLGDNQGRLNFDLIIVRAEGKLVVDDELCGGGDPNTSIYHATSQDIIPC